MTTEQALNEIGMKRGQFFKIAFKRKTDKYVNGQLIARAGSTRNMLCRLGVKRFVKGVESNRKNNDNQNNVLTVFDIQNYNKLSKRMNKFDAGCASYRRINLQDVIDIS